MRRTYRIAAALAAALALPLALAACDPPQLPVATDCSVDVTAQLNSYIAAQPDGTTVTLPANACYRTDGEVDVSGKHDITLDGNGTMLVRVTHTDARDAKHVRVDQSSNLTVTNLTVVGERPDSVPYQEAQEGQAAIDITASDHITIDHDTMEHVYGDGLQVNTGDSNITLSNSTIFQVGRQGVALNDVDGFTINANVITYAHRWSMDYEPQTQSDFVTNGSVAFNQFLCPHLGFESGLDHFNVSNVTSIYNVSSWGPC